MIESRSESSLPPPLRRLRRARGVMSPDQGAEGKRMVPGPGRKNYEIQSPESSTGLGNSGFLKKGQPDNEAGLKLGFTEEKCFQCLKPGVVDPGRE